MKEKLQTLPLAQLRELAKAQGLKGITTLRKAEIIDRLCALAEQDAGGFDAEEDSGRREEKRAEETPAMEIRETAPAAPENRASWAETGRDSSENRITGAEPKAGGQESRGYGSESRRPEENQRPPRTGGRGQENNYRRRDYQGRNDYQSRNDYQGRGGQSRGDYQQRGENQPRSYQPRQESQTLGENAGGSDNTARSDGYSRTESQTRELPARNEPQAPDDLKVDFQELDSGIEANGILEVMPDGFGFIRCENFLPGENDVYVAPSQIRRFNLKTGDIVRGSRRIKSATEKFAALLYINSVNNYPTNIIERRPNFENLTPIFPNRRLHLEMPGTKNSTAMRVMDLLSPIGKGQRGMIVSPPKAGKTTLLKQVARAVTANHPEMHLIILLIDERPEEVTDIKEAIGGPNVEVIYSTFDELPDRHKRVSEMVIERAKRLVEHGRDVMILLDSITRLARAYNLVVPPSGRTLSGGLDPAALHMPKRFFGAARNMREGGSLTILATALIDTGSRMDDVIYEEFKGTGNMELVLDRKLSERRIFPAIDILGSGTRRDDLLLSPAESEVVDLIHKATNVQRPEETVERILNQFTNTSSNKEFVEISRKRRYF